MPHMRHPGVLWGANPDLVWVRAILQSIIMCDDHPMREVDG